MQYLKILLLLCLLVPFTSFTQNVYDRFTGKPYVVVKMTEYQGTQFLFEDWKPASVMIEPGVVFKDVLLLYDIYNNLLYFKKDEKTFLFDKPVNQFEFFGDEKNPDVKMVFRKMVIDPDKKNEHEYVQVLAEGNLHLLKSRKKFLAELYEYNRATTLKEFTDVNSYHIISNDGQLIKGTLLNVAKELSKNYPAISSFTKKNGKIKSEVELTNAIIYLNNSDRKSF